MNKRSTDEVLKKLLSEANHKLNLEKTAPYLARFVNAPCLSWAIDQMNQTLDEDVSPDESHRILAALIIYEWPHTLQRGPSSEIRAVCLSDPSLEVQLLLALRRFDWGEANSNDLEILQRGFSARDRWIRDRANEVVVENCL